MLCTSRKQPAPQGLDGKDTSVRKPVARVCGLWTTRNWGAGNADIHNSHNDDQLLRTLSRELKSRVSSLLVDLSIAILRHACSTVV